MKTILFIAVLWASQAYSWSCDNAITEFTDASVRSKCIYRYVNHMIENLESSLLGLYKYDLAQTDNRIKRESHITQNHLPTINLLLKFYEMSAATNPQDRNVFITNKTPIPINQTTSSSSQ